MYSWGQVYTAVYGWLGAMERGVYTFGTNPNGAGTGDGGGAKTAVWGNKNLRSSMGAVTNGCPSNSTVVRSFPGSNFSTFAMYCSNSGCPAGRGKSTKRL